MIVDFFRISWAQRGIYGATLGALSVGAVCVAVLAILWDALAGDGDEASLVVLGAIALACTLVVLRAVTQQGVVERWPVLRRLRIIGLGAGSLRRYLLVETAGLGVAATVLGYLAAVALTPLAASYFFSVGLVPVRLRPIPTGFSLAVTAAVIVVVAVVSAAGAARAVTRREPVTMELYGQPSGARRVRRLVVNVATGVAAAIAVGQAVTVRTSESGFLWGVLAAVLVMAALARGWRVLSGAAAAATIGLRPKMSASALVSRRWTVTARRTTTATATIAAIGICVLFAGYFDVTDRAARARLTEVLAGATILEHRGSQGTDADTALLNAPGVAAAGVTMTRVDADVRGSDAAIGRFDRLRLGPAQLLTPTDAQQLLAPVIDAGELGARPAGVVVTRDEANLESFAVGDEVALRVIPESEPLVLPVLATVTLPSTFGHYFIVGDAEELGMVPTGDITVIAPGDATSVSGWTVRSAEEWVEDLAPGKAVSAMGGGGTTETPLLIGAPLALCLALAVSSSAITTLARRREVTQLGRIGLTRWGTAVAVVRASVATTIPPALLTFVGVALVLLAAVHPYTAAVGVGVTGAGVGPVWLYVLVALALLLATVAASLTFTRTALFRAR